VLTNYRRLLGVGQTVTAELAQIPGAAPKASSKAKSAKPVAKPAAKPAEDKK